MFTGIIGGSMNDPMLVEEVWMTVVFMAIVAVLLVSVWLLETYD